MKPKDIPGAMSIAGAVQIYYLAASTDCVKQYKHIVQFIINCVKAISFKISDHIYTRYIVVHADDEGGNKDIIKIYENAGFKVLLDPNFVADTIPMICDIYEKSK